VITLRTFSKFHSIAGVRVGYALADPAVVAALHKARQPFNVSLLAQAAGLAALECTEELRPMALETIRERERVRAEVRRLGMECPPSQTNFIFVALGESDVDLFAALSAKNIIVRPMGQFGSARNTYRVSIGTPEENDKLLDALREILGASKPS
jgi:histidinol-phosphate aminotransferase